MQLRMNAAARPVYAVLAVTGLLGPVLWADHAKMASPGETADAAGETAQSESAAAAAAPPEKEWLVGEDGKRYHVEELDLGPEGKDWRWLKKDETIRLRYGITYDVVSREDGVFKVKVYERTRAGSSAPAGPSAEELEQQRLTEEEQRQEVAATYHSEAETGARLRFEPFDRGLPRRGQWRNGFDVADMNGDGHPDIVFGAHRKAFPARPNIFLGDGQGSWRLWPGTRYPNAPFDYGDAATADFNDDGHMDLALGLHLRGVLVLVGDGEGRFERWSDGIGIETPGAGGDASTFSSRALEVADWNSDGRPDLLALGEGPKGMGSGVTSGGDLKSANGPVVFLNNGDGTWRSKSYESWVFGDALALGDFNGDERLDFATANNSAGNRHILHLGLGTDDWEVRAVGALRPGSFARAVASGRLDGDARDDLVVGYVGRELGTWRTGVDVLYATEDLEWRREPLFTVEDRSGVYGLAIGDVDGDGRRDIAFATGKGEVMVFVGNEKGFFTRQPSPDLPEPTMGCRGYGVRLSDLSGDGRDELIVAFAGERGDVAVVGTANYGCPEEGSLRAWSAVVPEAR